VRILDVALVKKERKFMTSLFAQQIFKAGQAGGEKSRGFCCAGGRLGFFVFCINWLLGGD